MYFYFIFLITKKALKFNADKVSELEELVESKKKID